MKKRNFFAMLMVLFLMATCFSACGDNAEGTMKKTLENMSAVKDLDMKMSISMDIGSGESESFSNTKIVVNATCFENPYKMKLSMDMLGMVNTTYYNQDGDKYFIYSDSGIGQWTKQELNAEDFASQEINLDIMDEILELADQFEIAGTEQIDGKKTTKISGKLDMNQLIEMMGSSLSSIMGDTEALDIPENLGDIGVSFWITSDYYISKIYIDLTELISKITEEAQALEEALGMNFKNVSIEIALSNFNNATAFEIPQEALDAELLDDIDWEDTDWDDLDL